MIGILMLDTAFPRVLGDIGNPDTFDHPVRYAIVPGATPDAIVLGDVSPWVEAFIDAGKDLVASGCTALVTTCGFLTPLRAAVQVQTGVPVTSSSLELIPALLNQGHKPGILTISAASLTQQHLIAAGVPRTTPIQGVDDTHFASAILGNQPHLDTQRAEKEMIAGATALCAAHPKTDIIVLECTNMPPYADAITQATRRPTVSILTAIENLQA